MIQNSFILDKKTLDQIRHLVSCANLEAVRCVKFAFTYKPILEQGQQLDVSSHSKLGAENSDKEMLLTFDLRVQGNDGPSVALEIAARFQAKYSLPKGVEPTSAEMKTFAKANGMLNVWPYWREFVQSSTSRAGLPPLTLPLFRIVPQDSAPRAEGKR